MMKKILSLTLLGATTSLMAMYAEHAYLYKDPRIMGMGGANIAVGSYSTSVFSNPAGLATIKKENGLIVDLLGIGVSSTAKVQEFVQDINDASDTGNDAAVSEVLKKYSGEHFHIGVDNYSSVSGNADAFAWSIGLLAVADVNLMAHANGSTTGGLLETSSRAYGGVVLGAAKPYDTEMGRLDIGMGLKYITQNSYEGVLGISELTDDSEDIGTKLQNKYEKTASGIGFDIGATLHPFDDNFLHPAFGLSVLNIGSMNMDDNYGRQPMTVNIGISISPEVPLLEKFVVAVDYVDLLNANKLRIYEYSDNGDIISFSDYEDSDFMKRLRIGTELGLIDSTYFSTALNFGLYQGAYTAGLNLEVTILKLNFATYEEQIGSGSVDISDRRYMAQVGIGW
ncbi:MAG: hypothetical protein AUK54_03655 [Helicobacteraceae bacterium CG2_30_36_10]|nr:MAG: hypothetical protein AUK54_03655 [Helicobacteraceae bacterium CG2_30_36_10]